MSVEQQQQAYNLWIWTSWWFQTFVVFNSLTPGVALNSWYTQVQNPVKFGTSHKANIMSTVMEWHPHRCHWHWLGCYKLEVVVIKVTGITMKCCQAAVGEGQDNGERIISHCWQCILQFYKVLFHLLFASIKMWSLKMRRGFRIPNTVEYTKPKFRIIFCFSGLYSTQLFCCLQTPRGG